LSVGRNKMKSLLLVSILAVLGLTFSMVSPPPSICQPPPPPLLPMTISGYVFINRTDGKIITAPAGLYVYAKEGETIINSLGDWTTNQAGQYSIGASASAQGAQIDMWVQNVNVTRITFQSGGFLNLNLTVNDRTPPTIQPIAPAPGARIRANQKVWINATLTDDLALNISTIKLTLNETQLLPTFDPSTGLLSYLTSQLPEGLYLITIKSEDIAGNKATKTWNFTAYTPTAPIINIVNPTTQKPAYTQTGKTIRITYNYTEINPVSATIKIYNTTHTIATKQITNLIGGTNVQRTDNITIPSTAADGKYNINITMSNIYNLSATAIQLNAIIVDTTPPKISNPYQTPPGIIIQPGVVIDVEPGQNITVRVNVTDANPIQKVTLYYNTTTQPWQPIEMAEIAPKQYEAKIPASTLNPCTKLYYYIKATDIVGNEAQTPTAGLYFQNHIIPEYTTLTILAAIAITTLATMAAKKRKQK